MSKLEDILDIPVTTGTRGVKLAQSIVEEYLKNKVTKVKTEPGKIKMVEK